MLSTWQSAGVLGSNHAIDRHAKASLDTLQSKHACAHTHAHKSAFFMRNQKINISSGCLMKIQSSVCSLICFPLSRFQYSSDEITTGLQNTASTFHGQRQHHITRRRNKSRSNRSFGFITGFISHTNRRGNSLGEAGRLTVLIMVTGPHLSTLVSSMRQRWPNTHSNKVTFMGRSLSITYNTGLDQREHLTNKTNINKMKH